MKRISFIAVLLIAAMALPAIADEMELGISATPIPAAGAGGDSLNEAEDELATGFTVGYRFLGLLYADWHGIVMPPRIISNMTAYRDSESVLQRGPFRPGFLNTFNFGAKIALGPFVGFSTIGVNDIYVYKQDELQDQEFNSNFGTNFRFGAGLRGANIGVNLSVMGIFPDFDTLFDSLAILFGDDDIAAEAVAEKTQWIPTLYAVLYL